MAGVIMNELPLLVRAIDRYDRYETPERRAASGHPHRAAVHATDLGADNKARLATWDKFAGFYADKPIWRVPAAGMKREREHIVALAPAVILLLANCGSPVLGLSCSPSSGR
jgi:hypothetical protein